MNKRIFTGLIVSVASISMLVGVAAHANDYLPPPTGPYQSSVVINTSGADSDMQPQVYRFPPADLIQSPMDLMPSVPDVSLPQDGGDSVFAGPGFSQDDARLPEQPAYDLPAVGGQGQPFSPDNSIYANPWATNPYPAQQSQGAWAYPYGGYAYPYGYSGQYGNTSRYNNNTSPFSFMPSPWSVMPMQPYSGQ